VKPGKNKTDLTEADTYDVLVLLINVTEENLTPYL